MDPIAVTTLVFTVICAVAAIMAVYYAKRGPTKEDLARVEANTAEITKRVDSVRDHMAEQARRESLTRRAEQLTITVTGDSPVNRPLQPKFTLKDAGVTLTHVDLLNSLEMRTWTAKCVKEGDFNFSCLIDPAIVEQWSSTGVMYANRLGKPLQIRVFFQIEGREAHRKFPVDLAPIKKNPTEDTWVLSGMC